MWARWEAHGDTGHDASTISRVWALMIRNHAKSFDIEAGVALLREFIERYPPMMRQRARRAPPSAPRTTVDLRPSAPPSKILDALHDLPRMSPSGYATPSPQYPRLTFRDLELLHHRCVALRDVRALNLITRADREYRM